MRLFVGLDNLTARVLESTVLKRTFHPLEHPRDLRCKLSDEERELFG